jgi:hypothetical protein
VWEWEEVEAVLRGQAMIRHLRWLLDILFGSDDDELLEATIALEMMTEIVRAAQRDTEGKP